MHFVLPLQAKLGCTLLQTMQDALWLKLYVAFCCMVVHLHVYAAGGVSCPSGRPHLKGACDICQAQPGASLMMRREALLLVLGCLPALMACSSTGPVKVAALEAVRALSSSSSSRPVLGKLLGLLLQRRAATLPLPGDLLPLGKAALPGRLLVLAPVGPRATHRGTLPALLQHRLFQPGPAGTGMVCLHGAEPLGTRRCRLGLSRQLHVRA